MLSYEYQQKTVQDIFDLHEAGRLNLEPGFQRKSIWSEMDRRKLIDSLLKGYPLPSIFLFCRSNDHGTPEYDVIDGKQRIESILMFTGRIWGKRFEVIPDEDEESGISEMKEPAWKQRDVFPVVQQAIDALDRAQGVAKHETIIDWMLGNRETLFLIDRALSQRPEWDRRAMAGNMIDWMSAEDTKRGLGEFSHRFEKRKDEDDTYSWYSVSPAALPCTEDTENPA